MPGSCEGQSHGQGFTHQQLYSQRVKLLPKPTSQSQGGWGNKSFNLSIPLPAWLLSLPLLSQTLSESREQRTLADVWRASLQVTEQD